ncbi:MAG TPA: hypothetical protein VEJ86_08240 [Candidatus Binataceae bacterium]|nr:hypothetical protein [Candidatus Binataceae bacterium]
MSSPETRDEPDPIADEPGAEQGDALANKLSKELSNWRRRRTTPRPRRPDHLQTVNRQSEPARTIKVRGHETLVVRKPKLVSKSPSNSSPSDD